MDAIHKYYQDKAIEARDLRAKIAAELLKPLPDIKLLKRLRKQLELAEYVGD